MSKWIQKALSGKNSKGKLHRKLNVPEGKKIPSTKLKKAQNSKSPTLKKEVKLAETLKSFSNSRTKI